MRVIDVIEQHPAFPDHRELEEAIYAGRRAKTAYRTERYLDAPVIAHVEVGSRLYNLHEESSDIDLQIIAQTHGKDLQMIFGDLDVRISPRDSFLDTLHKSSPNAVDVIHSTTGMTYIDKTYHPMFMAQVHNPYEYRRSLQRQITHSLNWLKVEGPQDARKILKYLLRSYCMIAKVEANPYGFISTFEAEEREAFFMWLSEAEEYYSQHTTEELHHYLVDSADWIVD